MPSPFTQFTNLDFDQIKTQIKDYLRANSNFTDFDFEGSNFSVLIDTLAYNTYITAFNSNMVVNESFLDSATLRENVVSLARNIGYVPRSKTASRAAITFEVPTTTSSPFLTLQAGLVCVGSSDNTTFRFSITEDITTTVKNGIAKFGSSTAPVYIYQGNLLTKQWTVDNSQDQRFILENPNIDIANLVVYVKGINDTGLGREYYKVDNILRLDKNSEIYLIQEVQDEKYELLFGDGYFGRKLENNSVITVKYIVTDGARGNGASNFDFQGNFIDASNIRVNPSGGIAVNTIQKSSNGGEIESIESIKYFAPRLYSSQYRAVTSRDYEAIIQSIYPNTESVSVIGGEDLNPPQYGKVQISIKPKNGNYISDFDKQNILNKLKQYSIAGINQQIIDLKILYVEIDSSVYYNANQVSNVNDLQTSIISSLTEYSKSVNMNRFGGRFKYSKVVQLIDRVDNAITSNITKVRVRRDMKVLVNQFAQYELCFGNRFHINPEGYNIKSTGFKVQGFDNDTVYFTDVPLTKIIIGSNGKEIIKLDDSKVDANGNIIYTGDLAVIKLTEKGEKSVILKSAGTVDYTNGEIIINTINITSTVAENNIIEIQAFPDSNDIIGLKDLYLSFDIANSEINMRRDVIASGEDISGVTFTRDFYTSSYSNGEIERK